MSANELWTPTRVRNFMRELKMKATKWDENIVALSKRASMSVDEFLKTDPITFGEKIWGKDDWKYTGGYPRVQKLVGEWTYYKMWRYYENTPVQRAEKVYKDAKALAIKQQEALGLTTWRSMRAEDKAGWEQVFAENKAAKAAAAVNKEKEETSVWSRMVALRAAEDAHRVAEHHARWAAHAVGGAREAAHAAENAARYDAAVKALRDSVAAAEAAVAHEKAAAEQEAREAAHAAEKATRYDAAVEADERYYAGRTHEQVVADEEAAAEEKRAAKWPSVTAQEMIKMMEENPETTAAEALEVIWAGRAMKVAAEGRWEGKLRRAVIEEQRYYDEKRAARGPSVTLEDIKRIVGDRTDMTGREVLEIFAKEWQEKQAEEEAHNNWMFERFRDAVKLNDEESVHVPVAQEATPLEAARKTYDKTNTEFEEVYERTKSGAGTWGDVDEAYSKLDEAAMNLAQEENKPSLVVEIPPIIQDTPADDSMAKEIEKGVETLEEFFMNYMRCSNLSLIEMAKLRIKTANNALDEMFVTGKSVYMKSISGFSPEEQERLTQIRKLKFTTWRERAEKELADLETQFAVVESVWECPTCTACWRTGS